MLLFWMYFAQQNRGKVKEMKEIYEIPEMEIAQVSGESIVITSLSESDSDSSETKNDAGSLWGNDE